MEVDAITAMFKLLEEKQDESATSMKTMKATINESMQ